MHSSATVRLQVEATLAQRVPAALTLKMKQAPELFPTGINAVDQMLGGGIPRGAITDISGARSTGKTCFALSTVAAITQLGNACAWMDVNDTLEPETVAAAGIELQRLLWLRMFSGSRHEPADKPWSRLEQALSATDLLLQAGGFAAIVLDMSDLLPQHAMRIPLATWYRFRLAAEHARTAVLLLTQVPCAGSCAALALRCEAAAVQPFQQCGETALFAGQQYAMLRERNRNEGFPQAHPLTQKKPVTRAAWQTETSWSRMR